MLINRQDVTPLGAGELSTVPVPAAIASAIFDAIGIKLREVPLRRSDIGGVQEQRMTARQV